MSALEWLTEWVQEKHRLCVGLETDPEIRLNDRNICLLLFDIVQELLLNVVKHSGIDSAMIHAGQKGSEWLQLTVRDEGGGCDPTKFEANDALGSGFGIASVRQRLQSIGGTFEFNSTIGEGTTVTIGVPLRQM